MTSTLPLSSVVPSLPGNVASPVAGSVVVGPSVKSFSLTVTFFSTGFPSSSFVVIVISLPVAGESSGMVIVTLPLSSTSTLAPGTGFSGVEGSLSSSYVTSDLMTSGDVVVALPLLSVIPSLAFASTLPSLLVLSSMRVFPSSFLTVTSTPSFPLPSSSVIVTSTFLPCASSGKIIVVCPVSLSTETVAPSIGLFWSSVTLIVKFSGVSTLTSPFSSVFPPFEMDSI